MIEDELTKIKDPKYLYDKYFKGSDSNITLKDLQRMRGLTILIDDGKTDDALLFGVLSI